jgi:hypothetical protein
MKFTVKKLQAAVVVVAAAVSVPVISGTAGAAEPDRVTMHAEIVIPASPQEVFRLVGDYPSDPLWRIGVISIVAPRHIKIGDEVVEKLQLSSGSVNTGITNLVKRVKPTLTVLETTPDKAGYMRNDRKVTAVSRYLTKFSDTIVLDRSLLAAGFPGVPVSDIAAGYQKQMMQELTNAKNLIVQAQLQAE